MRNTFKPFVNANNAAAEAEESAERTFSSWDVTLLQVVKSNCVSTFHNKQFQLQGNVQVSKVLYQTVKYVYFQYHI